ncbi:two-component system response regulator [Undibacterium seohonense]|jgi:putative two-component system response regulator|uniref:Two-component system response regulator n=1 Tax=Undibacterium seohonense TaxID=1344950 RepID=A0ABR6X2G6_9BURK|nr:two-component system response regulator [Undibacterium seohonense]MBC3807112.1 two-component system response regulator [Undibacterium seohonense]
MRQQDERPKILVVDDAPTNLQILRQVLHDDYRLLFALDGDKALKLAQEELPNLILLDVMMPGLTGLETCQQLKANPATKAIPVIFVTALSDASDESAGFAVGAVDYITKPISPPVVRARVKTHLSLVDVNELHKTRLQIIQCLGRAAEYRDNETGLHVIRMSHYSRILALAAGFSEAQADLLFNAAPMHDIGKIGTPDHVLLKPGKLDQDEWTLMQKHVLMGAEILGEHDSPLLQMARLIALYHHEKFDGSGYPHRVSGTAIPIEARIVAIADVFDALTSIRPYKKAWEVADAVDLLRSEKGKHFDPELVDLFIDQLPSIVEIKEKYAEDNAPQ